MNELIITDIGYFDFRRRLLATVCTVTLLAVCASPEAMADRADRPTVWIELGAQVEHVDGNQQPFVPSFSDAIAAAGLMLPAASQQPPHYAMGGEGKISFEPEGTDWLFAAGIRYGRSNGNKAIHQSQILITHLPAGFGSITALAGYRNVDTASKYKESHVVLDFQAGKDEGLGMFGPGASSSWALGMRLAQFTNKATVKVNSTPDYTFDMFNFPGIGPVPLGHHGHTYNSQSETERSFTGIGPSAAWNASARLTGSAANSEVTLDWGFNAAVLFGRQKADRRGHEISYYEKSNLFAGGGRLYTLPARSSSPPRRSHSVVVPNLGGFAGVSMKFPNAKVSLGYRADFFFGAMDEGMETRHTGDRSFHGPFATVSIGLGG